MKKKLKILMHGYIGHGNFGDDLLFEVAIRNIKILSNIEVYVYVHKEINAEYLLKYYSDLILVKYNNSIPILANLRYDKVYFIGGGIFFDYKKSMTKTVFYKRFFSNFIRYKVPYYLGTKYAGIGIGIGPYFCDETQKLHSLIYKCFDVLGLRDKNSFELAKKNGVTECILGNDLSLLYKKDLSDISDLSFSTSNKVVICPRLYSHNRDFEIHLDKLLTFSEYLKKEKYVVRWVFLQKETQELFNKIQNRGYTQTVWDSEKMNVSDFFKIFNDSEYVITSRMHAVFISGMLKKKIIAIEVHPKLRYSNELFYSEDKTISPLTENRDYKLVFNSEFVYNDTNLNIEFSKTNNLNNVLINWLKN
jgi:polysaccharide pyruvyl transferase WcaK-like protein